MLAISTRKYSLGFPAFCGALVGFMGMNAAPETASIMPIPWARDNVSPRNARAIIVTNTGDVLYMGITQDTSNLLMQKNISIKPAPHITPDNTASNIVSIGGLEDQGYISNIMIPMATWIKPTVR